MIRLYPGEGKGHPLQYSGIKNYMDSIVQRFVKNSMKRQKDRVLKNEIPRWVGTQNTTRDQ